MANAPDSDLNARQAPDLIFVNVSDLAGSDSQHVRRLVRSSATRHSHRDPLRKPKARKAARNRLKSEVESVPNSRGNSPAEEVVADGPATCLVRTGPLFSLEARLMVAAEMEKPTVQVEVESHISLVSQAMDEPNNAYPVESEEWFPWILSQYRTSLLPAGLAQLQLSHQEGADYINWFMREGLTEPALFYAQLLSASTALLVDERSLEQHIEWLRAKAMQSLNDAVGDSARLSRPATLMAIAFAALFEHVHGAEDVAADVHGNAFAQLLSLSGGVQSLTIPRLGWKVLLWVDDVVGGNARADEISSRLTERWIPGHRE